MRIIDTKDVGLATIWINIEITIFFWNIEILVCGKQKIGKYFFFYFTFTQARQDFLYLSDFLIQTRFRHFLKIPHGIKS